MYLYRSYSSIDNAEEPHTDTDSSSYNNYSQGSKSSKGNKGSFITGKCESSACTVSAVEEKFFKFLDKHWDRKKNK